VITIKIAASVVNAKVTFRFVLITSALEVTLCISETKRRKCTLKLLFKNNAECNKLQQWS